MVLDESSDDDIPMDASPPMACALRQASDVLRQGHPPACAASTRCLAQLRLLPRSSLRVVFLDIDGVLAPRINAGQLVWQCVQGVVELCTAAQARIVLTSSWRLLPGMLERFNLLLTSHHSSPPAYDVTPDLRSEEEGGGEEGFPSSQFIRVKERAGLTAEDATRALAALGEVSECAAARVRAAFCDPSYDLHVYSETNNSYHQTTFSPRAREGGDWSHDPPSFARTRVREIVRWLQAASDCGVEVSEYVVIDDDDLLQTGNPPVKPIRRNLVDKPSPRAAASASNGLDLEDDQEGWMFAF
ncbi:MAG: hypothetical protein SGPRY_002324 [Prymnesium sp.]